jgi:predicted glycoside hydrolase/deacetylase ChbG (UPF0249 family)
MLIVTADDYGADRLSTDAILSCAAGGRITSASAMVFMRDSERAAGLAAGSAVEFGLHLNFTEAFDGPAVPEVVRRHHDRVRRYLGIHTFAPVVFHPGLHGSFRVVFEAQCEEYHRLYNAPPRFYNGHHHMHLCTNVLLAGLIPRSSRIRNTFTFGPGQKGAINRVYRSALRRWIAARYTSTDSFFSVAPADDLCRLGSLAQRSHGEVVELETHPDNGVESALLNGTAFGELLKSVRLGTFSEIEKANRGRGTRPRRPWSPIA